MNFVAIILLGLCFIWTCPVAVDITDIDDYDPGSCDKSNALQVYSVNDRNDEKKLWICSNENGNYLWKPVDGEAYVGEFLYPGKDCSDILNKELDADDGFYWITLGVNTKRRVWCDMKTDGGGYMLVARKHDAITWDVPSKDQPVEPHSSETYWTSQLGDAPILDFRIQFSTSDSFDDTKAHWSFRLNNTRNLGNLMITNRGCDALKPGIGDIAYVKDLMTEKVVTTTFECSVFGKAKDSSIYKSGWPMMNECLKKPCTGSGYLHLPGQAIPLDHTGVFSFSTTSRTSGINNDATAYVGCSFNKCCGCFGPAGRTGNYCDTKCNAINGGTIINPKNIYTWIWVRPSLPKRIWNRCMEYQRQDENGQLEWFNLVGDSAIPEKGRCLDTGKLRLNSGVVVVPNNATAKKVPWIPGLLAYRKDQKKLYVRANKTWALLTQEKEVKDKLMQLEKSMDARFKQLKGKIQATDTDLKGKLDTRYAELKGKIGNVEATDINLQGKIDTKYTELEGKIDAGHAELKKNLSIAIQDYNVLVEVGKKYPGCTEYMWLLDSDRRYNYYDSNHQKCDDHLNGWYRFGGGAGNRMSTTYNGHHYCKTGYPGYLSGGHPGVNDGIVTRTVCFYYSGSCGASTSIKVINCAGLYYVYYLNGVPVCTARYCSNWQ